MGIPARTRRHRKRAKAAGLRIFRGRLGLDGTVIAGDRRISEVVYGYRFPSYPGRIKIGYSSRGLERVVEQSTAFPETPEVVFVIHDSRARDIEKAFHIALAGQQADVMGVVRCILARSVESLPGSPKGLRAQALARSSPLDCNRGVGHRRSRALSVLGDAFHGDRSGCANHAVARSVGLCRRDASSS